jgi:ribosome biogenesis GTPase
VQSGWSQVCVGSSSGTEFDFESMAKRNKKNKLRAEFRKKHDQRTRKRDFTRQSAQDGQESVDSASERISGKGNLTRKRTIIGDAHATDDASLEVQLDIDHSKVLAGRVVRVLGPVSEVESNEGTIYRCSTRGLLKSLSTDQRNVLVTGDRVYFELIDDDTGEGIIVRVEPRKGIISRVSRSRQHVIAANVDWMLIITSAAMPTIKPNLIDRFIVTAEQAGIEPIICINKVDLVNPADLQPLAGVYGQMGYRVLLLSATESIGIDFLRSLVMGKESVVVGQSGVGKSSLLNAIEPGLGLRICSVSEENQKGRHTTTNSSLVKLSLGGYIVDTPGIRQFQLWDLIPEEIAGLFRDIRCYVSHCRFPNCSHTHESDCAVKHAVADYKIDLRRYESYCQIVAGDQI